MYSFKQKLIAYVLLFVITVSSFFPKTARADFWGMDIPLLIQIVTNTVNQVQQLQSILGTGQDSLNLLRSINKGINDSLALAQTIAPDQVAGLYSGWNTVSQSLAGIEQIYGAVMPSPEARIQKDADQNVAEAIKLNNSTYDYAKQIDQIGEEIKNYSHQVSPAGAQKLTAQTLGVVLHVLNQSLRTQSTVLKLHAQEVAIQNHKEKEQTRQMLAEADSLKTAMQSQAIVFDFPRF